MNSVMLAYINPDMQLIDGCNQELVRGFTERGAFQVTRVQSHFSRELLHQVLILKETLQNQFITRYVLTTLKLIFICAIVHNASFYPVLQGCVDAVLYLHVSS